MDIHVRSLLQIAREAQPVGIVIKAFFPKEKPEFFVVGRISSIDSHHQKIDVSLDGFKQDGLPLHHRHSVSFTLHLNKVDRIEYTEL